MTASEHLMFCYQCEQTAGCTGCMGRIGVCGKPADVARVQDELTGALIELACVVDEDALPESTWQLAIECLFATMTNVNFDADSLYDLLDRVRAEQGRAVFSHHPGSEVPIIADYDMNRIWDADEDVRSLKSLILFGIRGMAAYAYHALVLGFAKDEVNRFFIRALRALAADDLDAGELLALALEVGEKNLAVMEMLESRLPSSTVRSSWCPATTCTTCSSCSSRRAAWVSTSTRMARCCPPTATRGSKRTRT